MTSGPRLTLDIERIDDPRMETKEARPEHFDFHLSITLNASAEPAPINAAPVPNIIARPTTVIVAPAM
jgi:hypothetical protein